MKKIAVGKRKKRKNNYFWFIGGAGTAYQIYSLILIFTTICFIIFLRINLSYQVGWLKNFFKMLIRKLKWFPRMIIISPIQSSKVICRWGFAENWRKIHIILWLIVIIPKLPTMSSKDPSPKWKVLLEQILKRTSKTYDERQIEQGNTGNPLQLK